MACTHGFLELSPQRLDPHGGRAHLVLQLDPHAMVILGRHTDLSERALHLAVVSGELAAAALLQLELGLQVTKLEGKAGVHI